MNLKKELTLELESTHSEYIQFVTSIPVEFYEHSSSNPAWSIGDILYHIALGPRAILVETWMVRHAGWLLGTVLNNQTARIFNRGNALLVHQHIRITPQFLIRVYGHGHAGLLNSLEKMPDADFNKSVRFPDSFVTELAGIVTVERLFRYIKLHFEIHAS